MLFIKTKDLKTGMRLAKPIYNRLGVLLYDRESTLTQQAISSVENFGLLGLYVLEPAEPAPPLTEEEIEFERFQTIYIFRLQEILNAILNGSKPKDLNSLSEAIISEFGHLDHKFPFSQNLRSKEDYYYKHSLNVAILCAMICHAMNVEHETTVATVTAALLHDIGLLNLPEEIRQKQHKAFTPQDIEVIEHHMQQGYQLLQPTTNSSDLPSLTLRIIGQTSSSYYHPDFPNPNKIQLTVPSKILLLANEYDTLTAMGLHSIPCSDLKAFEFLEKHADYYDPYILKALMNSIHILPKGSCVVLSNGQKAMVIEDNPSGNFKTPVVLQFSNNVVLDLGLPDNAKKYKIVDVMKTLDNRIQIDEETLKHFHADAHLVEQLNRIKQKRNRSIPKKRVLK